MKTPEVSIITPVYNTENYLRDSLESVRNQSFLNWEHILVDDCSKDKSLAIIKGYAEKDPRVKYIKLLENNGAGVARNKAIEMAEGSYIAFLDSDDLWHPLKLEKQIKFMRDNKYHFTFTSYDQLMKIGR